MQSHIPAALGGRPSPFGPPLHAAGDPSRPSSTSAPSPFAQSPLGHSPFSQSSGLSSSAASRAISPRLSNGNTPAGAVSPLSGTRSPTLSAARPDHLRTSSLTGTPAVSLAGATGLGVGSSVAPSNDDIEAVIQLAMASSPAGSAGGRDTRTQLFVGNVSTPRPPVYMRAGLLHVGWDACRVLCLFVYPRPSSVSSEHALRYVRTVYGGLIACTPTNFEVPMHPYPARS